MVEWLCVSEETRSNNQRNLLQAGLGLLHLCLALFFILEGLKNNTNQQALAYLTPIPSSLNGAEALRWPKRTSRSLSSLNSSLILLDTEKKTGQTYPCIRDLYSATLILGIPSLFNRKKLLGHNDCRREQEPLHLFSSLTRANKTSFQSSLAEVSSGTAAARWPRMYLPTPINRLPRFHTFPFIQLY